MSATDRSRLFVILGVLGGVAILFFLYVSLAEPYFSARRDIATLESEVTAKDALIGQKKREKLQMERWRMLSLAGAPNEVDIRYRKFLLPLLTTCGLSDVGVLPPTIDAGRTSPSAAAKKPPHTFLAFNVDAKGELSALAKFLEQFDKAPHAHRVKSLALSLESKETSRLTIKMTIEVVIVSRTERQSNMLARVAAIETLTALERAPVGLAIAGWNVGPAGPLGQPKQVRRDYQNIAKRNIFLGAQPPGEVPFIEPEEDMRKYYRLTEIRHNQSNNNRAKPALAYLRNLAEDKWVKLLPTAGSGYDSFRVRSDSGEIQLDAKVLRIDHRDVYFENKANGRIYALHIGQSVLEAMERSLTERELTELGLRKEEKSAK